MIKFYGMGGRLGRTTRVTMLGIALCFLAALFFVEAKTTWADSTGLSPTSITAAKARAADRGLAAPAAFLNWQIVPHQKLPAVLPVLALIAFLMAAEQGTVYLLASSRQVRRTARVPIAHFNRPPPSRLRR